MITLSLVLLLFLCLRIQLIDLCVAIIVKDRGVCGGTNVLWYRGRGGTRGRLIQGRMVRPVFLEGNGFVTRGGMCELEFSVHAALGDDKVMLSFYDCSVEEA